MGILLLLIGISTYMVSKPLVTLILLEFVKWFLIFQVVFSGLLPLALFSTLLASSMRRKNNTRRLKKTQIMLALLSGSLVYYAATLITLKSKQNQFFSCTLTIIVTHNAPWKLTELPSINTIGTKELFSEKYLLNSSLWLTLGKIISRLTLTIIHSSPRRWAGFQHEV